MRLCNFYTNTQTKVQFFVYCYIEITIIVCTFLVYSEDNVVDEITVSGEHHYCVIRHMQHIPLPELPVVSIHPSNSKITYPGKGSYSRNLFYFMYVHLCVYFL